MSRFWTIFDILWSSYFYICNIKRRQTCRCRLKGLIFTFQEYRKDQMLGRTQSSKVMWLMMSGQKFSFNMKSYFRILIIISGLNLIESYNYSDTCYYFDSHFPCGDICVNDITNICYCGSEQIRNKFSDAFHFHYCCTPHSVKCRK